MDDHIKTILLATDGEKDALLAARAATDLAARSGAELHVVHAWTPSAWDTTIAPEVLARYPDLFEDSARAVLNDEAHRIEKMGGTVAGQYLMRGHPAEQVVRLGETIRADLIVTGSRGRRALSRLVLGSVAEGILHGAGRPVLVVRGDSTHWPPARIVVGSDGSPEAHRATTLALRIGVLLGASTLLVRVIPERALTEIDEQPGLTERVREALTQEGKALSKRSGMHVDTLVYAGNPAEVLLHLAEHGHVPTLLVAGSRGLDRAAQWRSGSVSHALLHAAHCPVLITPPQEG
ncbi:MAG TPA: universal stress protein [Thermomicrobiaceae bacterium]|nr:universal stress protein [Thermomicrobiaceae bacterium]